MAKNGKIFEEKNIDLEKAHKAIVEFYEALENEREKEEKEILLKRLREVTKDKEIVLGNYIQA